MRNIDNQEAGTVSGGIIGLITVPAAPLIVAAALAASKEKKQSSNDNQSN